MWIQLSERDANAARREKVNNINKIAIALTVVPVVILSVVGYLGFIYIKWTGRFFGSMDGLAMGLFLGLIIGWWLGRGYKVNSLHDLDAMKICVKCGSNNHKNDSDTCLCGGSYIPLFSARWQESDWERKNGNQKSSGTGISS